MEKMLVKGNLKFPTIDFNPDSGVFEIFGRSLPENTIDFYSPVLEWIDEYKSSPAKNTIVNVSLEYFNTSSSKLILDIFKKFHEIHESGNSIHVNWFYEEDDPDLQNQGELFQEISGVPMSLHSVKEFSFVLS